MALEDRRTAPAIAMSRCRLTLAAQAFKMHAFRRRSTGTVRRLPVNRIDFSPHCLMKSLKGANSMDQCMSGLSATAPGGRPDHGE